MAVTAQHVDRMEIAELRVLQWEVGITRNYRGKTTTLNSD